MRNTRRPHSTPHHPRPYEFDIYSLKTYPCETIPAPTNLTSYSNKSYLCKPEKGSLACMEG